jgi:hypothetical protein
MAKAKRHKLLRALLGMKHSPAGKRHLKGKKKDTEPTYFKGKGFQRKSIEAQLRAAGVSESKIIKMKGKK